MHSNSILLNGMWAAAFCILGCTTEVSEASPVAIGEVEKACTIKCQNGGKCEWYDFECTYCTEPIEDMYCDCPDGFEGEQCEIVSGAEDDEGKHGENQNEACTLQCDNGGGCAWVEDHLDIPRFMRCDCAPGFEGGSCEREVEDEGIITFITAASDDTEDAHRGGGVVPVEEEECAVSCNNGGVCKWNLWDCGQASDCNSTPYMYCDCPPGFEGPLCNKESAVGSSDTTSAEHEPEEVNPCSLKCANGSECITETVDCSGNDCILTFDLMRCECPKGFEGDLCDKNVLESEPTQLEGDQEDAPCTKDCSGNGMCQLEEWDCTQFEDCISGFIKYMTCDCDDGYIGDSCEYRGIPNDPTADASHLAVEPKTPGEEQQEKEFHGEHVQQAQEYEVPRRVGAEVVAILVFVGVVVAVSLTLVIFGVRIIRRMKVSIASSGRDEAAIVTDNASKDAVNTDTGVWSADIV